MEIKNWTDYWDTFNAFCILLTNSYRTGIANDLEEAKLHVNGMTDGWFEFVKAFENTINKYRQDLTDSEMELSKTLIAYVKRPLTKQ